MSTDRIIEERLLTIKQVAELLASSVRHVWRLIASGQLPKPIHVGRAARLFLVDVEHYLERLRQERDGKVKGVL